MCRGRGTVLGTRNMAVGRQTKSVLLWALELSEGDGSRQVIRQTGKELGRSTRKD